MFYRSIYNIITYPFIDRVHIPMKDFLPLPFDLPAIKVTRNGKYSYLTTYLSIWEPAVLDENGNVIKKGRARTTNRKTVGKLLSEGLSGLVKFSTEFLIEHPQLVGLTIYRAEGGEFFYKKPEHEIDLFEDELECDSDDSGETSHLAGTRKVIESASGVPMSRDPAQLINLSFDETRKTLESRPKAVANELLGIKSGGSILTLEQLAIYTGVRMALAKSFMDYKPDPIVDPETGKHRRLRRITKKKALKYTLCIETVVYQMIINGTNTYEGLTSFCDYYAVADCANLDIGAFKRIVSLINDNFIDHFHHNFLAHYFKNNHERIIKEGLCTAIDGTPISHKNRDLMFIDSGVDKQGNYNNQANVQFICDASKSGLPLMYDVFNGRANDVSAFKNVLEKINRHSVNINSMTAIVDRGYASGENIDAMLLNGQKFIVNMPKGPRVNRIIKEASDSCLAVSNTVLDFEDITSSTYIDRPHTYESYPVDGKRAKLDEEVTLRYHVLYSPEIYHNAFMSVMTKIKNLVSLYMSGAKLTSAECDYLAKFSDFDAEKYLSESFATSKKSKAIKKDKVTLSPEKRPVLNGAAITEHLSTKGFQVLVTNDLTLSSAEVKERYGRRQSIEHVIQRTKSGLDGKTTKAKTDKGFQQKLLLQHIAGIITTELNHRVRDAREANPGKYANKLRSTKEVLRVLNGITVEQYKAGMIWKPIVGAQEFLLRQLKIELPRSVMTVAKLGQTIDMPVSVSEDLEEVPEI